MRFQSTSSFSKLAPTLITDAYGPFTAAQAGIAASSNGLLLGPPSAGSMYRIRLAIVTAATTTASTAQNLGIMGTSSTIAIVSSYALATGIDTVQSMDLLINEGLTIHNNTAVFGIGIVWWRLETIPS